MSFLKVFIAVLLFAFLGFLSFGSTLINADEYWQRVRLFLRQKGELADDTGTDGNKQQIKKIWRKLPLKERLSARLPQSRYS